MKETEVYESILYDMLDCSGPGLFLPTVAVKSLFPPCPQVAGPVIQRHFLPVHIKSGADWLQKLPGSPWFLRPRRHRGSGGGFVQGCSTGTAISHFYALLSA